MAWQPPGATGFTVIPGDYLAPNGLHVDAAERDKFIQHAGHRAAAAADFAGAVCVAQQCLASNSPAYVISAWQSLSNAAASELSSTLQVYNAGGTAGNGQTLQTIVQNCGMVYFVTGNTNFAERAWLEISNACSLSGVVERKAPTPQPGRDDFWYRFGLRLVLRLSDAGAAEFPDQCDGHARVSIPSRNEYPGAWYVSNTANNWAMVFNCGAAIWRWRWRTICRHRARSLLTSALTSMASSIGHFTTDNGGYYEGSEYWDYGVTHLIQMLAGVQSSLGTQFCLDDTPGLNDTALFEIYNTGPTKLVFNYADSFPGNIAGISV